MQTKKGLGKGLNALIPQGSVFTGGRTIVNVDITKVIPNPRQPRTSFNDESLNELAESIKSKGVAQPILVRMRKGSYELIAGERRLRAGKLAGLSTIPAIVKDFSDEDSMELALIENIQREDLNAMDESEAYQRLLSEFKLTQQDIAKRVGKNRSTVANSLRLIELPPEIKESLHKDQISSGHARALLAIEDKDKQLHIFKEAVKNKLSVRDIEILVYGAPKQQKKGKRRAEGLNEELKPFIDQLSTYLGTKVAIKGNHTRGRIEIDYYSQEDLERLLEIITNTKIIENTQEEVIVHVE
ncbi:MAG: chromosome partitioning protein ParB family [Candidatus Saganbacteria bacterium]|uniref:Chromosome partitioning protein ParB family n=1 Tax=Candidatus Saganbacteria bacterium TaxID=2575572 RepID=A0A833L1L1_UNCSA|nr:MAG: chromosome partitioning protein ParB family [Candidatus Saganbacteria bacterium]